VIARVDGWVTLQITADRFFKRHPSEPSLLVRGVKLMDYTAYLVASKGLEREEANRWRSALQAMHRDGSYARILKKFGVPTECAR
jgi:hypothetical protein